MILILVKQNQIDYMKYFLLYFYALIKVYNLSKKNILDIDHLLSDQNLQ